MEKKSKSVVDGKDSSNPTDKELELGVVKVKRNEKGRRRSQRQAGKALSKFTNEKSKAIPITNSEHEDENNNKNPPNNPPTTPIRVKTSKIPWKTPKKHPPAPPSRTTHPQHLPSKTSTSKDKQGHPHAKGQKRPESTKSPTKPQTRPPLKETSVQNYQMQNRTILETKQRHQNRKTPPLSNKTSQKTLLGWPALILLIDDEEEGRRKSVTEFTRRKNGIQSNIISLNE
ncbi:hypothetical protein LXL04_026213 [Taraxacum kok-saghyz]